MASDNIANGAAAVALAATGAFAGAALYITAVEHPAAMKNSVSHFYSFFPDMYHRAARMQGALALVGSHAAMIAAAKAADKDSKLLWAVSGAALVAVWPFTLFAMMPTNKTILKQDEKDEAVQAGLLAKWGSLHSVRTLLSCTSFAVMVATVLRSRSST